MSLTVRSSLNGWYIKVHIFRMFQHHNVKIFLEKNPASFEVTRSKYHWWIDKSPHHPTPHPPPPLSPCHFLSFFLSHVTLMWQNYNGWWCTSLYENKTCIAAWRLIVNSKQFTTQFETLRKSSIEKCYASEIFSSYSKPLHVISSSIWYGQTDASCRRMPFLEWNYSLP